jgi:hypothetical protein
MLQMLEPLRYMTVGSILGKKYSNNLQYLQSHAISIDAADMIIDIASFLAMALERDIGYGLNGVDGENFDSLASGLLSAYSLGFPKSGPSRIIYNRIINMITRVIYLLLDYATSPYCHELRAGNDPLVDHFPH